MPAEPATELYKIRSYEVDPRGQLKLLALCNYLQESAGSHARQLGVSVDQLLEKQLTWFLWRLHVQVLRLPKWGETVAVTTWPAELGKPYAVRDFRVHVGEEEIGIATTAWILMDIAAMRPVRRMPPEIRDLHPDPPRRALEDRFRRLPGCDEAEISAAVALRRSDLDLNAHLNHVAALDLMLEALPASYQEQRIVSLEAEYRGEGKYGDVLESRCATASAEPGMTHHSLAQASSGKELVRGRCRWT